MDKNNISIHSSNILFKSEAHRYMVQTNCSHKYINCSKASTQVHDSLVSLPVFKLPLEPIELPLICFHG